MSLIDEITALLDKAKSLETENAALREQVTAQALVISAVDNLVDKVMFYRARHPQPLPAESVETAVHVATIRVEPMPRADTDPTTASGRRSPRPVTSGEIKAWADDLAQGLNVFQIAKKWDRSQTVIKRNLVGNGYLCKACGVMIPMELDGVCPACKAEKATRMVNPGFLQEAAQAVQDDR